MARRLDDILIDILSRKLENISSDSLDGFTRYLKKNIKREKSRIAAFVNYKPFLICVYNLEIEDGRKTYSNELSFFSENEIKFKHKVNRKKTHAYLIAKYGELKPKTRENYEIYSCLVKFINS